MPPSTAPSASTADQQDQVTHSPPWAPPLADKCFVAPPVQLRQTANRLGHRPAYWIRQAQGWQPHTWADYAGEVQVAARALLSLGLERGDAVAILSFNCPAWSITAMAAMSIGAVPAGIYWTSSSAEIEYILQHCKAPVLIVEEDSRLARVADCIGRLPHLRAIIQLKGLGRLPGPQPTLMSWQAFMAQGDSAQTPIQNRLIDQSLSKIQPGDTATLIYTSGTTGPAKAVIISHGNLWWTATTMQQMLGADEHDRLISYLPMAHIAEQLSTIHNQAYVGYAVYFASSIEQLGEYLKEVQPTVFFGVPRVWEKMQAAIEAKLQKATGLKARMAAWAMSVGRRWHECEMAGRPSSWWLNQQKQLAQRLLYNKVKQAMGLGQTRLLSTGAAPIAADCLHFFTGLDVVLRELYGQSEACGPSTFNLPGATRVGSVGKPLPHTEMRVADDGELLIRGPHIFQGYLGQPAATAQALHEGWLLSGDLGHIDEDGYVYITGRKKDLIITSGGKNISPANIEAALMDSHLIEHAVVCGDGRHYLTALLTLEAATLADFAHAHGLSGPNWHQHPLVQEALQKAVDHVNEQQARVAQIRKFAVLSQPLTIEGGELTATLKIKRKVVLAREQALIDALYAG